MSYLGQGLEQIVHATPLASPLAAHPQVNSTVQRKETVMHRGVLELGKVLSHAVFLRHVGLHHEEGGHVDLCVCVLL